MQDDWNVLCRQAVVVPLGRNPVAHCRGCCIALEFEPPYSPLVELKVRCPICQAVSSFQVCQTCPAVIVYNSTCHHCFEREKARAKQATPLLQRSEDDLALLQRRWCMSEQGVISLNDFSLLYQNAPLGSRVAFDAWRNKRNHVGMPPTVVSPAPLPAPLQRKLVAHCIGCGIGLDFEPPVSQKELKVRCPRCQAVSSFQVCWTCPAVIVYNSTCLHCFEEDKPRSKPTPRLRPTQDLEPLHALEQVALNYAVARDEQEACEASLCVVCLERVRSHVLTPCGHFCVCEHDAAPLQHCPLCRVKIVGKVKVFQ